MSDYISKKKLISHIEAEYKSFGEDYDALQILGDIEDFPTVERPHGEWKYESYGQYLSTYKCSNCGFHGDKQWICCPYCGTDMRGKNDE